MDTRHLISLIISPLLVSTVVAQVSVQIADPILEPGESTVVVVTVSDAIPECVLQVYGVHTATLVQFKDTTVRIPNDWPNDLPFLITLPVQALPNVVAVWGQYLIVAEITGAPVVAQITALSPGIPCSGNVPTGHTASAVTFSWEARGSFSSFEIIYYENPCGQYPPSTPTTPGIPTVPVPPTPTTYTPSTPITPSQPANPDLPNNSLPDDADWSGNEELPPLPPGWEWGPNGPHWTGQGSPALPPGWEWGPLRPVWTGTGQPPTTPVIATSAAIPCNPQVTAPTIYSQTVNIAGFLQPGDAFVYQVYGVTQTSAGHTTAVLSETVCDRYSPISGETGTPVENTPCYAGCTVDHEWVKKTPIKVTRPLESFPTGEGLKEMIPGSCISFSVLANDVDLLKQICQGDAKCESTQPAIKRLGPYAHGVQYKWTKTGEGELKDVCQNTIFYKTPASFKKSEKKVATIDVEISNVAGKAGDDAIHGKINITMTFIDSCKCIDAKVDITQPVELKYDLDFTEVNAVCNPKEPEWINTATITGSLTIQKELCPNSLTILKSNYTDSEELKLICEAQSCGRDEKNLLLDDPLTYAWNDDGAGGSFPLGSTGPCVLYKAPPDVKKVLIKLNITDSKTQFTDDAKDDKDNTEIKQTLDLTEINVNEKDKYSNITVGHLHKFTPVLDPKGGKIKKIIWELDLGGSTGKVRKVLCNPDGMTPEAASLKFTTKEKEEDLEVSWRKRSHIHGIKDLKCKIYGEGGGCTDCCLCEDDKWEKSDFLGRDSLEKQQFRLFFDKEEYKDDGKVESLAKVRDADKFGEYIKLHGENAINWFTHWSASTYGTCHHDHKLTDPKVRFKKTSEWLGLYEADKVLISIAIGAAEKQKRDKWTGTGFIESSEMRWIDTKLKSQPAYDLKGHTLANKVSLHETGHFMSMTKNWRQGEVWQKTYGDRTTTNTSRHDWSASSSSNVVVTVTKIGTYGKPKADGIDVVQKFDIRVILYTGNGATRRVIKDVTIRSAWFVTGPTSFTWTDREQKNGTTHGDWVVRTLTDQFSLTSLKLEEFARANDPDEDYVPNQEEDKVGTSWNNVLTHLNHARGDMTTSTGQRQCPDQEFWADQYALDRLIQITPGKPDKDWANPGAQTDPKY